MNDALGDDIHLRGICERNVKIAHQIAVRDGQVDVDALPGHLADIPLLADHHWGKYVNGLAAEAGCPEEGLPYSYLIPLADDTLEDFLSEYFYSQGDRNESEHERPDPVTSMCRCQICSTGTATRTPATVQQSTHDPKMQQNYCWPVLLPRPLVATTAPAFCCAKFAAYHKKRKENGRFPPGRQPHNSSCPAKQGTDSPPTMPLEDYVPLDDADETEWMVSI